MEKERRRLNSQHGIDPHLLDQITSTLTELNKTMENVQFVFKTTKSLDLPNLFHSLSSTNALELIKGFDLQHISSILQSPEIRRMLTDPELYSLLAPDTGTTPGTQPNVVDSLEQGEDDGNEL
jgi:uncharacterized protein YerC